MPRQLEDMVVIITGASAGIGRALAIALAHRGAKLVLSARRMDRLEELNKSLSGRHFCFKADVSDPAECQALIDATLQKFGRIDTLVCNAGYGLACQVAKTTPEQMHKMFQTNIFGTTDCIRAAVPIMQRQELRDGWRGQIMIVSSAAARRGIPYFGVYSATKAAQLSLAEALRVELKPSRIAVTSVHPVGTETEFFDVATKDTGVKMPPRAPGEIRQSAETVALKMIRAIERPRPESWPLPIAHLLLSIATLMPRLADIAMSFARGGFDRQNRE